MHPEDPAGTPFSPHLLAGEVALVTGGSAGLGLEMATSLAAHGCHVAVLGRSPERLAAAGKDIERRTGWLPPTIECDVRDPAGLAAARDELLAGLGAPTILLNNAAANFEAAAERMTLRAFETVVDVDLVGTFNVTRCFVPDMIERRHGAILNIIVSDPERGFPGFSHAGAAKAGVLSLTRSWAKEWGRYGIRVNAIAPGPIPTAGVAANMFGLADPERAFSDAPSRIPLGRLGTAADIATAATFLCSRAAAWITGASLPVDGGWSIP